MLKKYAYMGLVFQWEEGTQPAGAVPVEDEQAKPKAKARTTRNKAAKPANKAAADD